jgi:hypothetical protein
MPTHAAAPTSPEPVSEPNESVSGGPAAGRYASLAEQMFAEDDELFHTRMAQTGPEARGWVLSPDGGSDVRLSQAVVLGRNPSAPPSAAHAIAVAVNDPNRSVSKTHALIELREGLPWVTDLNSTNGTTLTNEVGEAVVCVPGSAVPAGDNWLIGLGEYSLRLIRSGS